jgi:predicted GNAT superfamily acetyltransferase
VNTPGVEIRPLQSKEDFEACVRLQQETWGQGFSERVPVTILKSIQQLGGVVSGAFDESGRMVGFVFGITGWQRENPHHWSDMLAVLPGMRDRKIGEALKWHQRKLMLERNIKNIEWTFEPLEARNAWLNIVRLGATVVRYVRDYYGDSDATLHAGLGTDRFIVDWRLDSERVLRCERGVYDIVGPEDVTDAPLVAAIGSTGDLPVPGEPRTDLDSPRVQVPIPAAIQEVKAADADLAKEWRRVTRIGLETCMQRGYAVRTLIRYGRWSAYLLERSGEGR